MSSKTPNFNLHKIDLTDAPPDITVLNQNWDTLDTELKELNDALDELPDAITDAITVDSELSGTSTNPVQNKVINAALDDKLPLSAGKDVPLTGSLYFKGGQGAVSAGDTGAQLYSFPDPNDTTNGAVLAIGNTEGINHLARVELRVNGNTSYYQLYGEHNKPTPSNITAGTFSGYVAANASGQYYGTSLLRNTKLVSTDTTPTVDGEICWTYK